MARFIIFLLLYSAAAIAQVDVSIDKFSDATSFYVSFNNGSGNVSVSNNYSDFVAGNSSMQIDYSFNAGNNFFFTTFKNYSTATKDWSFNITKFMLRYKGGNANSQIKLRLWEDINRNGSNDSEDEVYVCTGPTGAQSSWTLAQFEVANFSKLAGNGNGQLDLNRIRAYDIAVENISNTSQNAQFLFDELLMHSTYSPPQNNGAKLSGSFVQLWNSSGCNCGQWTVQQWKDEMQKMKDVCLNTLVVQYSVYNDLAWYSSSNLAFVQYKESTLNKIFEAAEEKGIKIYVGLYFDENWNNADKNLNATYSNLLVKHQQVINELYNAFALNTSFKGWYIPQEINDLEWQSNSNKNLLFNWLQDVASYAHSKDASKKVMIAPFFNLWMPADVLKDWYNDMLAVATDIDQVFPQDGVGITLKNVYYDVPLFYSKIKEACDANGAEFGATVESFKQTSGWPVDNGVFSAQPTNINTLVAQINEANANQASEIIQFEWTYMQSSLYDDYVNSALCISTNSAVIDEHEFHFYPNPVNQHINFNTVVKSIKVYSNDGVLLKSINNASSLNVEDLAQGFYVLQVQVDSVAIQHKIVVQ